MLYVIDIYVKVFEISTSTLDAAYRIVAVL